MTHTLEGRNTRDQYAKVLDTLDKTAYWPREWAERQYIGLVVTAMCHSVIDDPHEARRYAVLRVLEVFLEHLHDLAPATDFDRSHPRNRIAPLAIPSCEEQCRPWLDVLEYMQLLNWTRKGVLDDATRVSELRQAIEEQFSSEILAEIHARASLADVNGVPQAWWIQ